MADKDEVISRARELDKHDLAKLCASALELFDYRKYAAASNFSIVEWNIALEGRFDYLSESTRGSGGNLCKDSDPWPWNGFRVWHAIRLLDEPLNVGYRRGGDYCVERTVDEMDLASAWSARDAIGDMPEEKRICELWWEFMTEHKTDPTEVNWELEADVIAFFQRAEEERSAKEQQFDGVFGSYSAALDRLGDVDHGGRFLHVNTSAPDAVIVEHFKQWLAAFRASERGRNSRGLSISETDMRKWAQNRVLAYLDISQFCKWSGLKLSAHKIGSMIFPDITDVDVAEKVRKTTAPLALSLVAGDMMEAIRLMASAATFGKVE